MKVYYGEDEWYPVLTLRRRKTDYVYDGPIELPDELYERYNKAQKAFEKVADEVGRIVFPRRQQPPDVVEIP